MARFCNGYIQVKKAIQVCGKKNEIEAEKFINKMKKCVFFIDFC